MDVNFNANANRRISPLKAQGETPGRQKTDSASSGPAGGRTDQIIISQEARQAAAQSEGPFSKMETAAADGDFSALIEAAKEKAGTLEVNWNKMVDPTGEIYGAAYVESIVRQYEKASSAIEAYYSEGHQENLSFDNPYTHLMQKYQIQDSPYFRGHMPQKEREMAFRQERALLQGSHVALNDPYALKSSGGPLDAMEVSRIAQQAAQGKLDALIKERMEAEKGGAIA